MKSIMEEASTITKAINQAWERAGQPQEFSVKILEHPQTSFFGFKTAKSAKIALFFAEIPVKAKDHHHPARQRPAGRPEKSADIQERETTRQHPQQRRFQSEDRMGEREQQQRKPAGQQPHQKMQQRQPGQRIERTDQQQQQARMPERDQWSLDMVNFVQDWVKETLVLMGKPEIGTQAHVSANYLKVTLNDHLSQDPKSDEIQLKSWAGLAMEAVREKAHRPLRSLRIILEVKK